MPLIGNQKIQPGFLLAKDAGGMIKFQYNPEDVTERHAARWANISIHGLTNPRLQYTSGDGRTLTFTLKFYHADESGKTPGDNVKWLSSLVYPDTGAGMPTRPPTRVIFSLGPDYQGVTCIVTSVDIVASKFDQNNAIRYAEVTLNLLEIYSKAIGFADVR